jgi:hypothetical protein
MDPQNTPTPAQNSEVALSTDVPAGVVNREAWDKLQELKRHPLYSGTQRVVQTSIEGLEVDVMMGSYALNVRVAPLPEAERDKIKALHAAANSIKGKISQLTALAFGGGMAAAGIHGEHMPVLDPRKAELIELFGKFHTVEDIHEIVTTKWGYQLNIATLKAFRLRHLSDIQARQEEVKRDPSHIRLGYKPMRMEELSFMHKVRKDIYSTNPSIANEKQLQSILDQIRKETEGEVSTVNIKGEITVQTLLDPVMRKQMLQQMSVLDIVIGRVAARLKRNPQFLIQRLNTSMYSKFSGMATEQAADLEATPIYPSQYIYDFDKIKAREGERKAEEQQLAKMPEVILEEPAPVEPGTSATDVTPPKPKMSSLKARMLAQLEGVKEQVNSSADKLNRATGKE